MQTKPQHEIDRQLDTLLRQLPAPVARPDFARNVWRQIRLTASASRSAPLTLPIPLLRPTLLGGLAGIALLAAVFTGTYAGRTLDPAQTAAITPILQPQTLAGIYLATHTGR